MSIQTYIIESKLNFKGTVISWHVLIMEEAIYLRESKEGLMYMYLTLHSHII